MKLVAPTTEGVGEPPAQARYIQPLKLSFQQAAPQIELLAGGVSALR
jgi:hypothetical protein